MLTQKEQKIFLVSFVLNKRELDLFLMKEKGEKKGNNMIINSNKIFVLKCLISDIDKKIERNTQKWIDLKNINANEQVINSQEEIITILETSKNIIKYILGYHNVFTKKENK